MKRALFSREVRTALPPQLIAVAIILGGVLVTEKIFRVWLADRRALDVIVLGFFTLSGFLTGARCFPSELKEDRYFFLTSLPLSRRWTWLCIVSARLLAGLTATALLITARALFWGKEEMTVLIFLSSFLLVNYVLLFFTGAAFSLLFRRWSRVYAAGSLWLAISGSLMLQWSNYGSSSSSLGYLASENAYQAFVFLWTAGALLLTLVFIVMSCQFFLRGELGSIKQSLRNSSFLTPVLAGALLAHLFITTDPLIARIGSSWVPRISVLPWEAVVPQRLVSDDGRHVFVQETLSHRPRFSRITLLDASTGRKTGRWNGTGVLWAGWVGDALRLLTMNDSPWDHWGLPRADSVDLVSVGLDGREMWRRRFQGAEELAPIPSTQSLLLVLRYKDIGKISLLDARSGTMEELARGPLTGSPSVEPAGAAWMVRFDNDPLPGKTWIVTNRAQELAKDRSGGTYFYVLFGKVYGTLREADEALLRKFPPGREGYFMLPTEQNVWFMEANGQTLFFVEPEAKNGKKTVILWALSTAGTGRWIRVATGLSPYDLHHLTIDFVSGFAAYPQQEGIAGLYLYDPALGRSFRIADGCAAGEVGRISLKRVTGLKGLLVELACREKKIGSASRSRYVEYQGSGNSKEIKKIPETRPQTEAGNPLYLDDTGVEIWVMPDGHLWRSTPGSKDQLLWSPGSAT